MHIAESIKHAPRWAWYTVAGVTAGGLGIKLWQGRAAEDTEQVAADDGGGLTVAEPGTNTVATPASPAVIVPPVITGNDDDPNPAVGGLSELFLGGAQALIDQVLGRDSALIGGVQETNAVLTGYLGSRGDQAQGTVSDIAKELVAQAGSAPQPVAKNPTPVHAKETMAQAAKRMKLHGVGGGNWADTKGHHYHWNGTKMVPIPETMNQAAARLKLKGTGGGYWKKGTKYYKWDGKKMVAVAKKNVPAKYR